jgi:hypothetical protein
LTDLTGRADRRRRTRNIAQELRTIQQFIERNPTTPDEELAAALGMRLGTLRDRRRVLRMGAQVIRLIEEGIVDYTAALRATQAASVIAKRRPQLTSRLGGQNAVEAKLLNKARLVGGLPAEITDGKHELTSREHVPDEALALYLEVADASLESLRRLLPEQEARTAVRRLIRALATAGDQAGRVSSRMLLAAPDRAELFAVAAELQRELERLANASDQT